MLVDRPNLGLNMILYNCVMMCFTKYDIGWGGYLLRQNGSLGRGLIVYNTNGFQSYKIRVTMEQIAKMVCRSTQSQVVVDLQIQG